MIVFLFVKLLSDAVIGDLSGAYLSYLWWQRCCTAGTSPQKETDGENLSINEYICMYVHKRQMRIREHGDLHWPVASMNVELSPPAASPSTDFTESTTPLLSDTIASSSRSAAAILSSSAAVFPSPGVIADEPETEISPGRAASPAESATRTVHSPSGDGSLAASGRLAPAPTRSLRSRTPSDEVIETVTGAVVIWTSSSSSFPFIDQVDICNLITLVNTQNNSRKEEIIHKVAHLKKKEKNAVIM